MSLSHWEQLHSKTGCLSRHTAVNLQGDSDITKAERGRQPLNVVKIWTLHINRIEQRKKELSSRETEENSITLWSRQRGVAKVNLLCFSQMY